MGKSLSDAVCNILPSTVGLDRGDAYAVAAFEVDQLPSTYKLVRPTWMNLFDDDVIRHTYDYVFYKFKDKFSDFSNFKKSCVPDKSVFQYLEKNGPSENEKGLTAYQKILTDYGAQMREVGCINEKVTDWYGSCRCENNHECDFAVARSVEMISSRRASATRRHIFAPLMELCQSVTCAHTWSISWMLYQASVAQGLERKMVRMVSPSTSSPRTSPGQRKVYTWPRPHSVRLKQHTLVKGG